MAVHPMIAVDPRDAPALLAGVVLVNRRQMRRAGPRRLSVRGAIRRGLFVYDRRDPDEHWKTYGEALEELRRFGVARLDCEDLAALVVAELQETGEDPGAFVYLYRARGALWHVIVGSPRWNRWLDPSVAAGMGRE